MNPRRGDTATNKDDISLNDGKVRDVLEHDMELDTMEHGVQKRPTNHMWEGKMRISPNGTANMQNLDALDIPIGKQGDITATDDYDNHPQLLTNDYVDRTHAYVLEEIGDGRNLPDHKLEEIGDGRELDAHVLEEIGDGRKMPDHTLDEIGDGRELTDHDLEEIGDGRELTDHDL